MSLVKFKGNHLFCTLLCGAVFYILVCFLCSCNTTTGKNSSTTADSLIDDTSTSMLSVIIPEQTTTKPILMPQNPILKSAYSNKYFNASKWLSSDPLTKRGKLPNHISEYDHIIKKMSRRYGFDWRLIAAQIYIESNFNPEAHSAVGARGLMQIMPSTARYLGFSPLKLLKPEQNIGIGCLYNQKLYSLWGKNFSGHNQLAFTLASYNAGRKRVLTSFPDTVEFPITWTTVHDNLPQETQSYVHKIYLKHHVYSRHFLP